MAEQEGDATTAGPEGARPEDVGLIGIADPTILGPTLEELDTGFAQLVNTRTRLLNSVHDAFTGLRSSSQIFRMIFFGLPLPIESSEKLLEMSGGPLRLVRATYKETGPRLFALGDVLAAIPKFGSVFPITSFEKLGKQLEDIREHDADAGALWFVTRITEKHLTQALAHESQLVAASRVTTSPLLVGPAAPTSGPVCECCGRTASRVQAAAELLSGMTVNSSSYRWHGGPAALDREVPAPKMSPARRKN